MYDACVLSSVFCVYVKRQKFTPYNYDITTIPFYLVLILWSCKNNGNKSGQIMAISNHGSLIAGTN